MLLISDEGRLLEPSSLSSLLATLSQIWREIRDGTPDDLMNHLRFDNQGEMRRDETWTVTPSGEVRTRQIVIDETSLLPSNLMCDGNTPVALGARC